QRMAELQFRQDFIRLLPTLVILVVVSGALLVQLAGWLRARGRGRRVAGARALLLVALVWPMGGARAQDCAQADAAGYYGMAVEMAQVGILDDALAAINCAILHDNTFTAAYEVRANLNARLMRWEAVIDDYNRLILLHSGVADYYIGRGNAYAALAVDNPLYGTQAMADFEQAITLDSQAPAPYIGLGNVMAARERYNEAVVYYEAALARNGEDVVALRNAAIAYANMGDYETAEARLLTALSFAPQDTATQDLLAELDAIRNAPTPPPQQVVIVQQQTALPTERPNLTAVSAALWLLAGGLLLALLWRRLKALRVYGGRR
ncbi:MAG: tetratricopeptide repeat protein, partial [Chloroflexi bacterium]